MKFLLSLDYELFFGSNPGTVKRCLLDPTEALLEAVAPFGVKAAFFVDGTYLLRLKQESVRFPVLRKELDAIGKQLVSIASLGHDVQLHVHPHWVDSRYDGEKWGISTARYRLHDFGSAEQARIVNDSKSAVEDFVGGPIYAFRAGGWCLQPFARIAESLKRAGIWLESTVYPGGHSGDSGRPYDFRSTPRKTHWRFSEDPVREDACGDFVEIPTSSFSASPRLFWRMALAKRLPGKREGPYGDGAAMSYGAGYYLKRLLFPSRSVASIDGMKGLALPSAFKKWSRESGSDLFHVMGHPKALTPYSLRALSAFLKETRGLEPAALADYANLRPLR